MNTTRWQVGRFDLDLVEPLVMGIVNMTPDSFSDGGDYSANTASAIAHARRLYEAGAAILDIGGESTRPGAQAITPDEEWQRVAPVLQELATWQLPISLDTRHTRTMQRALEKGWVDIINDVAGLEDEGAVAAVAADARVGVCLMHMKGLPESMQQGVDYDDVVAEVGGYLKTRLAACAAAGIAPERIILDPGLGFGKYLPHNIALVKGLPNLLALCARPMLIGLSRKRMIGELTQINQANERVVGSVAGALAAVAHGAKVVRVHDVAATIEGLKVWAALGGQIA